MNAPPFDRVAKVSLIQKMEGTRHGKMHFSLRMIAGNCPLLCGAGGLGMAQIYRSSTRSVTFRCPKCTLQWTVTIHRLAKAFGTQVAEADGSEVGRGMAAIHAELSEWAAALDEDRGRQKRSAG